MEKRNVRGYKAVLPLEKESNIINKQVQLARAGIASVAETDEMEKQVFDQYYYALKKQLKQEKRNLEEDNG